MTKTKRIRPAREGLMVLFPGTRRELSHDGEDVVLSTYWRRRLADGDVVEVDPPATPSTPKTPPASEAGKA